jgi:hypothetical protein
LAEEVDDGDSGSGDEHHEPQEATVVSRAKLVTIPKPAPPALPPRSPYRSQQLGDPIAPAGPTVTQHEGKGLGIDMDGAKEDEGLYPIPSHSSIEARLAQVHLAPSRDSERLFPKKHRFEEASMSGSDYSRTQGNTPGDVTPAHATPAEEPSEATIIMKDMVAADLKESGPESNSPPKEQADRGGKDSKGLEPSALVPEDAESFHSIPGTPAEHEIVQENRPPTEGAKREESKEEKPDDFA